MARFHHAEWLGDNLPNKTRGSMYGHKGLVVHADAVDNIDADNNWFHNSAAQVSAHFGIRDNGDIVQWVDTDDTAWAEVAGNHYWVSVEFEAKGEPLTQSQVESGALLFAWLHKLYGFTLHSTSDVDGSGLAHHSMGGADWGNHTLCPGQRIIDQKGAVVHRARALLDFPVEHPSHPCYVPDQPVHHDPPTKDTPDWYHRVLTYTPGDELLHGEDVKAVQRKVHVKADGFFGQNTVARVRGFQKTHDLTVDGAVGPATARKIG